MSPVSGGEQTGGGTSSGSVEQGAYNRVLCGPLFDEASPSRERKKGSGFFSVGRLKRIACRTSEIESRTPFSRGQARRLRPALVRLSP